MKLTVKDVDKAVCPPDQFELILPDHKVFGLALRVYPSGKAAWVYRYRSNGKRRRVTLGKRGKMTLEQARAKANKIDPDEEIDPGKETLGELLGWYRGNREEMGFRASTIQLINSVIAMPEIKPLAKRRIGTIKAVELSRVIKEVRNARNKRTGRFRVAMATALYNTLSGAYSLAVKEGRVARSPFADGAVGHPKEGLPPDAIKALKRDRVPSREELRRILDALNEMDQPFSDIVRVMILTGLRRGEVARAHIREFDLAHETWHLPPARMKNGDPFRVPLTPALMAIIRPRVLDAPQEPGWVFPSTARPSVPFNAWSRFKKQLDNLCGFNEPWVMHDLRRSISTLLTFEKELRISPYVADAMLAHKGSDTIRKTYQIGDYFEERIEAMNAWTKWLGIKPDPQDNVLNFRAKQ
jgi:integrase